MNSTSKATGHNITLKSVIRTNIAEDNSISSYFKSSYVPMQDPTIKPTIEYKNSFKAIYLLITVYYSKITFQ